MIPIATQSEQYSLPTRNVEAAQDEELRSFLGGRSIQAGYNNPRQAGQGLPMGVPSGYQYRQQDANQPRYKEDFMPGYEGADAYPSKPREGLPMGSPSVTDRSVVPQNHPSKNPRYKEDFMPGYEGADAYPSKPTGPIQAGRHDPYSSPHEDMSAEDWDESDRQWEEQADKEAEAER